MFKKIILYLEKNQKPCFFKSHTGFDCPACGIQTSVIQLLKGNFEESFIAYPALIPVVITFLFAVIFFFIFKQKKGLKILLSLIFLDIFLIFGNWFLHFLL
jgi:hypothetical protein